MQNSPRDIWLVGAGPMARDYAKVLKALDVPTKVIGRGAESAAAFSAATGLDVVAGGLDQFLATAPAVPAGVIIAVGVEGLADAATKVIRHGARHVLLEKPGALAGSELFALEELARASGARVVVAYNRRLYASTLKAQELIAADGGVRSMNFEFTEWSHVIAPLKKADGVKPAWLLGNSTHVIDLAFHLGGTPVDLHAYTAGALAWHPSSAVFAGAGRTDRDVLFSYQANWDAPGRWGVEVLTSTLRLIFRPMESLQVMRKGSVAIEPVAIDDALDKAFKPGLHEQVRRFLAGDDAGTCSLSQQRLHWPLYERIAGYAAR